MRSGFVQALEARVQSGAGSAREDLVPWKDHSSGASVDVHALQYTLLANQRPGVSSRRLIQKAAGEHIYMSMHCMMLYTT